MKPGIRTPAMALMLAGLALAGCTPPHEDLQQWMTEQRRQTLPKVTPISEPARYVPLPYSQQTLTDPFANERLTQALRRDGPPSTGAALIAAEQNRRREPLEAYPLDAMAMVGSLERGGQRVALVRVGGLLHQVRVGNYLGTNYGRVTAITEGEVSLREIVQDAASEWIERRAALQLQENTK